MTSYMTSYEMIRIIIFLIIWRWTDTMTFIISCTRVQSILCINVSLRGAPYGTVKSSSAEQMRLLIRCSLSGAKKYDHITLIIMDLHWLLIRRRVTFKVTTLVYKCLHGCAPVYLADDCVAVSSIAGRRFLRSSGIDCTEDKNNDFWFACFSCVWTNGLELVAVYTEIARTLLHLDWRSRDVLILLMERIFHGHETTQLLNNY